MKITLSQVREALKEAILDEKKKSKSKKKASAKRKSKKKSRRKKRKAKRDACYHKVKSRYKVWPSAYASGALVKCRKVGAKNWGNSKKESLDLDSLQDVIQEKVDELVEKKKKKKKSKKRKLTKKPSSETSLRDWFGRKGAPGKKKGWVDCNTCRKDKKTGRKKCSACGRSTGEKRAKYPKCRPTPAACGERGNYGKKSKAGKKG
tara:strand:- start:598 stop:1212 length:615 start_codon:yes stop_codon:yes gene_type:complete